jgi:hypothetical protein
MQVKEANRETRMPSASEINALGFAVLDAPVRHRQPKGSRRTHKLASTEPTPGQDLGEPESPRVRLSMSIAEAQGLADLLSAQIPAKDEQRLLDQLWLRTVLIEQRRRIRRDERVDFTMRADSMLAVFDACHGRENPYPS